MILAIDPGKHAYGVAWFGPSSKLMHASFVPSDDLPQELRRWGVSRLHLERQYLTKNHPRPMDIVDLACAAGFAKGCVQSLYSALVTEYQPIQWKGNVPKEIMIRRIQAKLDQNEVVKIQMAGYKSHNIYDAIGIGLFALGRL